MDCTYEDGKLSLCIDTVDLFAGLPGDVVAELAKSLETVRLPRGEILVEEGADADSLYFVVSGRFEIRVANRAAALAEVGAGQLIGEVAFLAGGGRTATATALRDSVVLRLGRDAFDALSRESPIIWRSLTITLAKRLAERNRLSSAPADPRPRTIALIPAGAQPLPPAFVARFSEAFRSHADVRVLTARDYEDLIKADAAGAPDAATGTLNSLEAEHDYVIYVADDSLTDWSALAVRQADLVVSVAEHDRKNAAPISLNDIERFAHSLHTAPTQRLVLIHPDNAPITGTRWWLEERTVRMHHHVCTDDTEHYARLFRFIHGTSIGLVACGGGALCAAHVGLYQALIEAGVTFDIMGGTSGGAAMAAAFAMGVDTDTIERQTQDMFVTGGAMRRYTLPVYSLLDQSHFDSHLRTCYGEQTIEDLWIPYFAVATNLSSGTLHCLRDGLLWQAVRASGSVPALLPPFFTNEGDMLVDGGLVDNVPIRAMHELKDGPNIVLAFHVPAHHPFAVNYDDLPSRTELLRRLATAKDRKRLGEIPLIGSVLARALMAHSHNYTENLTPGDILLVPPLPPEIGLLDWHRHGELKADAYAWTKQEMARLERDGDAALRLMRRGQ